MRKAEKQNGRPSLHAVKVVIDEPKASPSPEAPAVTAPANAAGPGSGDVEVAAPRRRTFTAEFKRTVLAEVEAAAESGGEVGAVLRRHGLYSSHLAEWRRARDEGAITGLAPRKRGRKPAPVNPLAAENTRLARENQRLLARAERAERLIELQKKVAELLGDPLPPPPPELMPPSEEAETLRARTRRRR
jgi:transposase-like protein